MHVLDARLRPLAGAAQHGSLAAASPARLRAPPRPTRRAPFRAAPRAISYSEEQIFGQGHGVQRRHTPARELSEEERQRRVAVEAERIRRQTAERSAKLREEAHVAHLDHELKFGKLMLSQGSIDSALVHFNNVIAGSKEDTYHQGEATLQKAACLEKLGREVEARDLYQSLIRFRGPYPNIKRRAAQALFGASRPGTDAASYNEHMYQMFLSGFGSYMPKEEDVQSKEEKAVLSFLPWVILLMAPLMLVGLVAFQQ